jgi:hypothetical protein
MHHVAEIFALDPGIDRAVLAMQIRIALRDTHRSLEGGFPMYEKIDPAIHQQTSTATKIPQNYPLP